MIETPPRKVWRTRRAIYSSIAVVFWFPGCLLAAWWQVHIALAGDSLGWVYSIEWPVFACFGVYFWWFLVHDDPDDVGRRKLLRLKASGAYKEQVDPAQVRAIDQEDAELRAYNDYLESLKAASSDKAFHLRKGAKSGS
jgi:hypothetical protein